MPKFLYLTRPEWVKTWVAGGKIPISLASTYRSAEREGKFTPDENLIHESPVDVASLRPSGFHFENVHDLTFAGNTCNGQLLPSFTNANYYADDGLILSFSNVLSAEVCKRLRKKACVEILDIQCLKTHIDSQLGVVGVAEDCQYTPDHQRNHFLKSVDDEWQQEFRMFWPITESRTVTLPPGIARHVPLTLWRNEMEFDGKRFKNEKIRLDGNTFAQCQFENCVMEYGGGPPPRIVKCTFHGCQWSFTEAASNTVAFLQGVYHGMGDGGRQLVEQTFENIRKHESVK